MTIEPIDLKILYYLSAKPNYLHFVYVKYKFSKEKYHITYRLSLLEEDGYIYKKNNVKMEDGTYICANENNPLYFLTDKGYKYVIDHKYNHRLWITFVKEFLVKNISHSIVSIIIFIICRYIEIKFFKK